MHSRCCSAQKPRKFYTNRCKGLSVISAEGITIPRLVRRVHRRSWAVDWVLLHRQPKHLCNWHRRRNCQIFSQDRLCKRLIRLKVRAKILLEIEETWWVMLTSSFQKGYKYSEYCMGSGELVEDIKIIPTHNLVRQSVQCRSGLRQHKSKRTARQRIVRTN